MEYIGADYQSSRASVLVMENTNNNLNEKDLHYSVKLYAQAMPTIPYLMFIYCLINTGMEIVTGSLHPPVLKLQPHKLAKKQPVPRVQAHRAGHRTSG